MVERLLNDVEQLLKNCYTIVNRMLRLLNDCWTIVTRLLIV